MQTPETMKRKGLGRGLGSLLGNVMDEDIIITQNTALPAANENERLHVLGIERIEPSPDQPRRTFDKEKLQELADSIREKGVLQPIIVRRKGSDFEIIAGERRWRAAQLAGLQEVPAIIRKSENQDALELGLIENIQRDDLNPVEEAQAYGRLSKQYNLTQQEIAQKVGKDRATIANSLRLLDLDPEIHQMIIQSEISVGHAKVLLGLTEKEQQLRIAQEIIAKKLSVRATESLVNASKEQKAPAREGALEDIDVSGRLAERIGEEIQKVLGTKVRVEYANKKGKISIHFYSDEQFNNLVTRLKGS